MAERVYMVPRGSGEGTIQMDLSKILEAEKRLDEIAIVTNAKAPELLSAFNRGWAEAFKLHSRMVFERNRADEAVREAKALALLGLNDEAVKKHGFNKSSADLRTALVDLDEGVKKARERHLDISLMEKYIEGKQRALENGFTSVKRIMNTRGAGSPDYNTGG